MTSETIAKFVDAFLADDADECNKPEYENLAVIVAMTYAESAWRTAMKRGTREPPPPNSPIPHNETHPRNRHRPQDRWLPPSV